MGSVAQRTAHAGAELERLLNTSSTRGASEAIDAFERADAPGGRPVVVFGAGALGREIVNVLRAAGRAPVALADNRLIGIEVDGVPTMAPADAVLRFGHEAVFVLGVFNPRAAAAQLRGLGMARIAHHVHVLARFGALPFYCLGEPARLAAEAPDVRRAFELLADERSREEYVRQVERRLLLGFTEDADALSPDARTTEYFPPDLYRALDDEVLVDCGAFDGDTVRRFLALRSCRFERIIAIEPDPDNYARLSAFVASLDPSVGSRVDALPFALGTTTADVRFEVAGAVTSALSATGRRVVRCERLDTLLRGARPTLVKMDLEGAELDAIEGAGQTVREHAPVLAVTVYHRCDHLWRVPLALAALHPAYRLHLRAHASDCWDVSVYAVPPGREVPDAGSL